MEEVMIFNLMEPVFTAVFTLEISMRWWISDSTFVIARAAVLVADPLGPDGFSMAPSLARVGTRCYKSSGNPT